MSRRINNTKVSKYNRDVDIWEYYSQSESESESNYIEYKSPYSSNTDIEEVCFYCEGFYGSNNYVFKQCQECWSRINTIYIRKSGLSTDIMNHIFSFLGIKINYNIGIVEYKSPKLCFNFNSSKNCGLGKYCYFII